MRVWKLQDCEYVAAETSEQATHWYCRIFGEDPDLEEIEEIPLMQKVNAAKEGEPMRLITFAEAIRELQEQGEKFPAVVGFDLHYA